MAVEHSYWWRLQTIFSYTAVSGKEFWEAN